MYRIFVLSALALMLLTGCGPSEEERAAAQKENERWEMQICTSRMTGNIERSCRADPEFAYCSLNYDQNEILGSGCARRIKDLPAIERADFCIKESLGTVDRACSIEVLGCARVTGNLNC